MRVLLAGLAVACATSAEVPPPERLVGCWAEGGGARMTWAASDPADPASLRGSLSGAGARRFFTLERTGEVYSFCEFEGEGAASARCFEVAQGRQGALEGGRVFIDQAGSRLRLSIVDDGPERLIFVGRRSDC